MDKLTLLLQLCDYLGWGDMQIQIAVPALQEILEFYDDDIDFLNTSSDEIFSALAGVDASDEDRMKLAYLRREIEWEMRGGKTHHQAIAEWWK